MNNHQLVICNNQYFFISNTSFCQNSLIAKELRKYINFLIYNLFDQLIESNEFSIGLSRVVCIGGESYLFGISNQFNHIIHYTNSKSIYNDATFNNSFYNKKLDNYHINYNNFSNIKNSDLLIINLAKLHINLLNQLNSRYYKYIIIINCHHNDFWKKIKLLTKFKIISRKQFIANNYFVTVTLLQNKFQIPLFISLGNTCAIAHQLKQTGLRTLAFPFDWCKISLKQINKVLQNNFNKFDELDVIKYSEKHKLLNSDTGSYILKNSYNILFAHELYIINNYQINNLKTLINKRIQNFINAKKQKIYFIIHNSELKIEEINSLISNLKNYFYIFKIIYITKDSNSNLNFNNNSIKIITIDYNIINWEDWKLSEINWFDIFFNKI